MSRAGSLRSGPWREHAVSLSGCLRAARSPAGTPVAEQGDELKVRRLVMQAEAGHDPRCREDRCGGPRPLMSVHRPARSARSRTPPGRAAGVIMAGARGARGRVAPRGRHGVLRARVCLSADRRPDVPAPSAMRPGHGPSHQGQCRRARPWGGAGASALRRPRPAGHAAVSGCLPPDGAGAGPPPGHVRRGGNMRLPVAAGSL